MTYDQWKTTYPREFDDEPEMTAEEERQEYEDDFIGAWLEDFQSDEWAGAVVVPMSLAEQACQVIMWFAFGATLWLALSARVGGL